MCSHTLTHTPTVTQLVLFSFDIGWKFVAFGDIRSLNPQGCSAEQRMGRQRSWRRRISNGTRRRERSFAHTHTQSCTQTRGETSKGGGAAGGGSQKSDCRIIISFCLLGGFILRNSINQQRAVGKRNTGKHKHTHQPASKPASKPVSQPASQSVSQRQPFRASAAGSRTVVDEHGKFKNTNPVRRDRLTNWLAGLVLALALALAG